MAGLLLLVLAARATTDGTTSSSSWACSAPRTSVSRSSSTAVPSTTSLTASATTSASNATSVGARTVLKLSSCSQYRLYANRVSRRAWVNRNWCAWTVSLVRIQCATRAVVWLRHQANEILVWNQVPEHRDRHRPCILAVLPRPEDQQVLGILADLNLQPVRPAQILRLVLKFDKVKEK